MLLLEPKGVCAGRGRFLPFPAVCRAVLGAAGRTSSQDLCVPLHPQVLFMPMLKKKSFLAKT